MGIPSVILEVFLGGVLMVCAMIDMKKREIPLILLGSAFMILCLSFPLHNNITWIEGIGGVLIGITLFGVNKISRGQIGSGDAFVFCITGVYLGFWENLNLLLYSLFIAAVFSIGLIIIKKVHRKYAIPFVPFVFLAYLGRVVL